MAHTTFMRRVEEGAELNCGSGGGDDTSFGLRVGAIFIILCGSMFGALFPVLARRTRWLSPLIPKGVFDFVKYFGSGVIIATAFIHLLDPALEALGSPCLAPAWGEYPYALAIAMGSIFMIFIIELIAFRWGTSKLASLGISHDPHGHGIGGGVAHGPETPHGFRQQCDEIHEPNPHDHAGEMSSEGKIESLKTDLEIGHLEKHAEVTSAVDSALTQIIGIAILEFGVLLHSVLIGLTLAVTDEFKVLFVVIVFHQTFEGLGIGSRLAHMDLPPKYNLVPILGAILYGITTPIGIAAGLGVRSAYNPGSTTASIVSGVLDSFSAGILIYTGLVELLAHEFLFNREMLTASNWKLAYSLGCMMLGCGIMSLLGKWA